MKTGWGLIVALLLTACASPSKHPVPIIDIAPTAVSASPTRLDGKHIVKAGENLYRIAFEHGVAYRDLAAWNNIVDINDIKVGQVLRFPASDGGRTKAVKVVVTGTSTHTAVQTQSLGQGAGKENRQAEDAASNAGSIATVTTTGADIDDDSIKMRWPVQGKIITSFAKNGKGIDLSGKIGQSVLAAAEGHVVYSGTGLRGYGRMIILKHNKSYLTAYAHNNKLVVKEGERVQKGQKIAEMGRTDADSVKLHFEVRRFGKPVDPTKYLTN